MVPGGMECWFREHDSVNAFLLSVQDKDARKCSLLTFISHSTKNMKHVACLPNICWLMNECITAWFLFLSLYSYVVYFPDFRSCAVIFVWVCFLVIASYCSDTARSSLSGLNLQQCIWGLNWLWKEVFLRRPKHPMTHCIWWKQVIQKRWATLSSLYFLTWASLPCSSLCLEFSFPRCANGLQLTSLRSLPKCYLGEAFSECST